jgi:penicillin-binding protein 1A
LRSRNKALQECAKGVDYIGIVRASLRNLQRTDARAHGASTITQQLARNVFLDPRDRSLDRKITEVFLARRIEESYTKSEILEAYLNRVYFGSGYFSVETAANGYFGKSVDQLTIPECATIAALLRSPSELSPRNNPTRSLAERNRVLGRMRIENFINEEQLQEFTSQPIQLVPRGSGSTRSGFVYERVREQAAEILGEEASTSGGFRIFATIDAEVQAAAERALQERLTNFEQRPNYRHQTQQEWEQKLAEHRARVQAGLLPEDAPPPTTDYLQGALLMLDNSNGGVIAMVGGRDYLQNMFNRALQMRRAPGTAFKPFIYATAFSSEHNVSPLSKISGSPIDNRLAMVGGVTGILGEWGFETFDSDYPMDLTARQALALSSNSATVRLGRQIGLQAVRNLCLKLGIYSEINDIPASFLGVSELGLDELTLAYTVFPNNGARPEAIYFIDRIETIDGDLVSESPNAARRSVGVIDEIAAWQVNAALQEALRNGTGSAAYSDYGLRDFPAGGKTGTHYGARDLWFVGYNSAVTTGVWVGFETPRTIDGGAFSHQIALPIWVDAMNVSADSFQPRDFTLPSTGETIEICRLSGMRATDFCYESEAGETRAIPRFVRTTIQEIVRPGTIFDEYCTMHSGANLPSNFSPSPAMFAGDRPAFITSPQAGGTEPVRMHAPTLVGPDPYGSLRPVVRARPVNDDSGDGTIIRRAVVVQPTELGDERNRVTLDPPPPINFELAEQL